MCSILNSIILEIPTSENKGELDGFFSLDTLKKLVELGLDIQLLYKYY